MFYLLFALPATRLAAVARPALALTARGDFVRGAAAAALLLLPGPAAAAAVTTRCYLDVRVINRYDVAVLEDAATRGRITLGLFGRDAPLGAARFLEFISGTTGQFGASGGGGPAYAQASFERLRPGALLEGGRISGLKQTRFAGNLEWEFLGRLLPDLRPVLEVNDLMHDRRGLLTRDRFESGPAFGITLGAQPSLDGSREVIGQVEGGLELLDLIEGLPFVTGKSLDEPGSAADEVFKAQKALFTGLSKAVGDDRAEDRTGKLLRRVEITGCGVL